jgi:hypothetical protein
MKGDAVGRLSDDPASLQVQHAEIRAIGEDLHNGADAFYTRKIDTVAAANKIWPQNGGIIGCTDVTNREQVRAMIAKPNASLKAGVVQQCGREQTDEFRG